MTFLSLHNLLPLDVHILINTLYVILTFNGVSNYPTASVPTFQFGKSFHGITWSYQELPGI